MPLVHRRADRRPSDKLDALKTHKKGLMQQLFPARVKLSPACAFPRFLEAGSGIIATLNDISRIHQVARLTDRKQEYWNGDIPWVSTGLVDFNMIEQANEYITQFGLDNSSAKIFPEGTILMAMYGQGEDARKRWRYLVSMRQLNQSVRCYFSQ
ncbi:MAG: hypothetical protein R3F40_12765 [Candidatus Competibacteraceae bacterium]